MDEVKEFCDKCGLRINKNLFDKFVYPASEFRDGTYCFGCSKRILDKKKKELE